eukprot:1497700-Rhodomonas_salina.1
MVLPVAAATPPHAGHQEARDPAGAPRNQCHTHTHTHTHHSHCAYPLLILETLSLRAGITRPERVGCRLVFRAVPAYACAMRCPVLA